MINILNLNNFTLSLKLKEAIKIGLSFAIVYTIALKLAWMNPYWAGLSIVLVSIAPSGQSIHKGALRVAGTIPAVIAALVIFTFAAQDRWVFVGMASVWMFFTTYMMLKDEQHSYMWNVAGLVCLVILTTSPDSSVNIFEHAVNRVLETTMGVIVYTLITVFLWPQTNINTLKQISVDLISTQAKLLKLTISDINTDKGKNTQSQLAKHQIILLKSLRQAFYAKGSDSYEVSESMPLWEKFHYLSDVLMKTTNQFYNGVTGLSNIDVHKLIPNMEEYKQEIIHKLNIALKLHTGDKVDYEPKEIKPEINEVYLDSLNSFNKIALSATKKELENMERLSTEILQCTKDLLDTSTVSIVENYKDKESPYHFFILDRERLKASFQVALAAFVGFVVWIYLDPPRHTLWYAIPAIVTMILASIPQVNIYKFTGPTFFSMLYALFIYSIIMPHLSSYISLGLLLGVSVAAMIYYFPPQNLVFAFISFILLVTVENQQVYDFATQVDTFVFLVLAFAFTFVFSYMVSTSRPEKAALSMLHRYFKNGELLLSELQSNKNSFIKKLKIEYYSYEVRTLPDKIEGRTKLINHLNFSENDSEKVEQLISNIYFLSTAFEVLTKSRKLSQTAQISKETHHEIHKWNKAIKKIFKNYSSDLDKDPSLSAQNRLKKHREKAEISINKHFTDAKLSKVSNQERAHFYQLIGSYQGLTEALIAYENVAHTVRLNNWKDEYFS